MISQYVLENLTNLGGVVFHERPILPFNVCSHCGHEDDPLEPWGQDDDGDSVCRRCEEGAEGKYALVKFNKCCGCHNGTLGSFGPATGYTRVLCQTCRDEQNFSMEVACRLIASSFDRVLASA